jgi:hypothetical protein
VSFQAIATKYKRSKINRGVVFPGCLTCRKRKVKCDELHPICTKCATQCFSCDWPAPSSTKPARSGGPRASPLPTQVSATSREANMVVKRPRHYNPATAHPNLIMPLAPSLCQSYMQCSNNLTLTPQDRHLWDFFPSTTFSAFYDFGDCSSLKYLVKEVARDSGIVMSMILATSASEMHKRRLQSSYHSNQHHLGDGLHHYSVALTQLRHRLASYSSINEEPNVELMVASIFCMVNYEIQFPTSSSAERIKMHLGGLWTLMSTHSLFQRLNQDEVALEGPKDKTAVASLSLSCQLILWCLYVTPPLVSINCLC